MPGVTPGAWFVQSDSCHYDTLTEVVNDTGLIVAEVCTEEDARMIAASPDMVAALQAVVAIYNVFDDDAARRMAVLKQVLDALRKAGAEI